MLYFENDYSEGAHPAVLRRLVETNLKSQPGYGADEYSESAKMKIRAACSAPKADIYFISGGTQTNALVVGSLLRPYEGVVSAVTGHVNAHEGGAVEFTGHKVLPLPHRDGKIVPGELRVFMDGFYSDPNHEHMVFPGMVYVSHPTEYGTLYTLSELTAISEICRERRIPLFLDGARLAAGLAAKSAELSLPDIARLCDVFYIGGTKCGALCGEALVFPVGAPEHFLTLIKQRGALLAKGRLCGVQFDALFTDGLYIELGEHAVKTAMRLKAGLLERGYALSIDSPTNQQFVIMPNSKLAELNGKVRYSFWEPFDNGHTVIRLATSWATEASAVEELLSLL